MLIDTHTHLDFEQFKNDRGEVIKRAVQNGVLKMINIGSSFTGSHDSIRLAHEYPQIYAAVGIHPQDISEATGEVMAKILKFTENSKVVAIGEIGLDFSKIKNSTEKINQIKFFRIQIGVAKEKHLPLIIHSRDAHEEVISTLKSLIKKGDCDPCGVFHCFCGNLRQAQEILDLGFNISFTGNITFKGSEPSEVISGIPLDKILIETDSPFLAPEPYRGKRCEPSYVKEVAKKISEIKAVPFNEVAEITTKNAEKLFNI